MKSKLLVAALAISGMAAQAGIDGSAHDFVGALFYKSGGETQLCAPCHAPHGTTETTIPLWNHAVTAPGGGFTLYTSDSMDATTSDPTGSSLACLSCHDGSLAVDGAGGDAMGAIDSTAVVGSGGDLSHEHPIAFTYTEGNGIKSKTSTAGSGTIDDWLVNGSMECSSCHDAHNGPGIAKLLRVDNANSALCTTCHDK